MIRANIGGKLVENSPNLIITYLIGAESTATYFVIKKIYEEKNKTIRLFILQLYL